MLERDIAKLKNEILLFSFVALDRENAASIYVILSLTGKINQKPVTIIHKNQKGNLPHPFFSVIGYSR